MDEGGEAPCYAHLVGGPMHDIVDDEDIERLVVDFYRQVAMDDLLGPIFAAARVDWNAHVATLVSFWSWQLLGRPGYDGHPLRAHEPSRGRREVHALRLCPGHYVRKAPVFAKGGEYALSRVPNPKPARGVGLRVHVHHEDPLALLR